MQKAFAGPLELRKRLGHLDVARIGAMDPEALAAAFRERPALHRFPGAMAERVRALCAFIEERYDGDAARIWREAASGDDLRARLAELPGFGEMKVRTVMTLLARQFGVQPPGIEALLPDHPTLGRRAHGRGARCLPGAQALDEGRTARGGGRPAYAVRRSVFDYFRALDGLADEEREIHATVRAFVDEAIVPNVQGWWDGDTLPRELITQMGELGILGPTTPAEYGGSGISSTAYGLICYELERGDSGVRSSASVQGSLVMYPIYAYGSEEQKRRYLPELASGAIVGCFGLTESDGGSDPGAMRTRARRDGDGYVLNGSKMWITNSPQADVAVVWAKDDDDVVQGFLVESDATGFSAPVTHSKASLRASITGEIVLEDVRVPSSARFPVDGGLKYPLGCLTQARYGIAWGALGSLETCLTASLEYTKTRDDVRASDRRAAARAAEADDARHAALPRPADGAAPRASSRMPAR